MPPSGYRSFALSTVRAELFSSPASCSIKNDLNSQQEVCYSHSPEIELVSFAAPRAGHSFKHCLLLIPDQAGTLTLRTEAPRKTSSAAFLAFHIEPDAEGHVAAEARIACVPNSTRSASPPITSEMRLNNKKMCLERILVIPLFAT